MSCAIQEDGPSNEAVASEPPKYLILKLKPLTMAEMYRAIKALNFSFMDAMAGFGNAIAMETIPSLHVGNV
jgi:hypothetical protein